ESDPREATLEHRPRALSRLPRDRRDGLAVPQARRGQADPRRLRRRQGRRPGRNPSGPEPRRDPEGARARDPRRGAALRRGAEGAAPQPAARGRRARALGQMREKELEEKMHAFLRGDGDVLVSTTIIESGLDIPQANTLVVERADALGLAQLYQIRGRVGRSDMTAHAYLFYPAASELSPEARARLATLADHTELGAGFAIAMRDHEIRGSVELLGGAQAVPP